MEKELYNKYYYGKVSLFSNQKSTIIGIIDSSGSMSSCWKTLVVHWNKLVEENFNSIHTIIFSNEAKSIDHKFLNNNDVGGGTNICSGFKLAHQKIKELNQNSGETDFTILFVSDGDDGDMTTIKKRIGQLPQLEGVKISLICVGIGSGFPTFVAMDLREKYHNGLGTIPAVFLVNDYNTEIEQNFLSIKHSYIQKLERIDISPPVLEYPWSTNKTDSIYETSYFLSESDEVTIKGMKFKLKNELTRDDIEELYRSWTQELQLLSIKESVRKQADIASKLMDILMKEYEGRSLDNPPKTVLERIEARKKLSGIDKLKNLIAEVKRMRDGVSLKDLSAEEAAKRLAIGTQMGKYHNKALQMRGLEPGQFERFRDEFINKLKDAKLNPETAQEPSFILFQTQKEILMESTLIPALDNINQYELIEVFPLVGQTLLINRSASSMINPFTINVLSIPRINKVCDTVSLVSQGNEMEISIGNNEEEKFNAVIPLYSKVDSDLKPLIRSQLFHLLMTFNCMRNVDTFYFDAYYGLLANTFIRVLKYSDSAWKSEMIDLIYNTWELVYGGIKTFEEGLELLMNKPREALITEHLTIKHKCEDVSKAILNLLILSKRGKITEERAAEIIEYIIIEHVGRTVREGTVLFETYIGDDEVDDFEFKPSDKKGTDNKHTSGKQDDGSSQIVQEHNPDKIVENINAYDVSQVIDPLDEQIESYIQEKKYLAFDGLKELKRNIKKTFLDFYKVMEGENKKNIKKI